ncbi:MAG: RHS repeat domain-containing protein [Bacteroidales bacterium]
MQNAPGLYNGNISHMVTTIMDANNAIVNPQLTAYRYDQLNRITKMKTIWGNNISDIITNNFWTGSFGNRYAESYRYDANGNIAHLTRNDRDGYSFDDLQYNYPGNISDANPTKWELTNNRLSAVLNSSGGFQTTFYDYDEIGNLTKDVIEQIGIEWNVYGKIKTIKKGNGDVIEFIYDAMGNRVCKKLTQSSGISYQLYTRDAQGNIMANYTTAGGQTTLTEFDLYGSSRIGIKALDLLMQEPAPNLNPTYSRILGDKRYEISNHLGNVITVFSDRKIAQGGSIGSDITDYKTHLVNSQDYTPFGMAMDGRGFNIDKYRFGFNGQEKTDEVSGVGNHLDFTYRGYDPRTGRFWSVDPLYKDYPWNSTYCFAENDVIRAKDLEGAEKQIAIDGSVISGPFILQKVNDDIVKQNNAISTEKILGANAKIMAQKLNQPMYKTPTPSANEKPLIKLEMKTKVGGFAKFKTKSFGYGVDAGIGASLPITTASYSDQGMSREFLGNVGVESTIGAGPIGASASYDGKGSASANIGPYEYTSNGNSGESEITVLDLDVGLGVGASVKLTMNTSLFSSSHAGSHLATPQICEPDATKTKKATPPAELIQNSSLNQGK